MSGFNNVIRHLILSYQEGILLPGSDNAPGKTARVTPRCGLLSAFLCINSSEKKEPQMLLPGVH